MTTEKCFECGESMINGICYYCRSLLRRNDEEEFKRELRIEILRNSYEEEDKEYEI